MRQPIGGVTVGGVTVGVAGGGGAAATVMLPVRVVAFPTASVRVTVTS